jgi:hypothetical protein
MTERKRMNQEEKQIAIAKACGWTFMGEPEYEDGALMGHHKVEGTEFLGWDMVPDYFVSRDAILSEIASLTKPQMSRFGHKLMERTGHWCCGVVPNFEDDCRDLTKLVSSPPDVLAEVFGLTLGLWQEGE